MDKDTRAMLLELQNELKKADALVHENFPIGGHARVEQLQGHLTACLRSLQQTLKD